MIYDDAIDTVNLEPKLSFSPVIGIVNEPASSHYYMLMHHSKPVKCWRLPGPQGLLIQLMLRTIELDCKCAIPNYCKGLRHSIYILRRFYLSA